MGDEGTRCGEDYDPDKPFLPQQSAAYQFKIWERQAQEEKEVSLADWEESEE